MYVQLCGLVARLCSCSLEAKGGKSWTTPQKTLMEIRKEGGSIVSGSSFNRRREREERKREEKNVIRFMI